MNLLKVEDNLVLVHRNNTIKTLRNIYYKIGLLNWILYELGFYEKEEYDYIKLLVTVSVSKYSGT